MKKIFLILILLIIIGLIFLYVRQGKKITLPSDDNDVILISQPAGGGQGKTESTQEETVNINEGITIVVSLPVDKSIVNTPSVLVKGTTAPNAEVFINEKDLKSDTQGSFSTTILLEEGDNYILVAANDD